MAYLELKNVCKSYGTGAQETKVLDNINLTIEEESKIEYKLTHFE